MSMREEQSIQTKNKIVRIALLLIKEKGYHNMSIRELCKEAGISTGAFYHHFSSKEELINQGFATYDVELEKIMRDYRNENPLDAIQFIILNQTEFVMNETANLTKELYIAQLSNINKYAVNSNRFYYQTIFKYVSAAKNQKQIVSDLSEDEITKLLIRITRGAILDWCLHDYSYDLLELLKKDLKLILKSLQ